MNYEVYATLFLCKGLLRQRGPVCDLVTVSISDFLTKQILSHAGRTVIDK